MPEILVDIHMTNDDGTVTEYRGCAINLTMEHRREVQRIYTIGSSDPSSFLPGKSMHTFQMDGIIVGPGDQKELPKVVASITHRFDLEE